MGQHLVMAKTLSENVEGYDLYAVRRCSCSNPIVIAVPEGQSFAVKYPEEAHRVVGKLNFHQAKATSPVFFVDNSFAKVFK